MIRQHLDLPRTRPLALRAAPPLHSLAFGSLGRSGPSGSGRTAACALPRVFISWFLLLATAHASGLAQAPTGPLRTAYTSVHIQADGDIARTTVTQVFANDLDAPVEAVYRFPLPEDAAVTGFSEWRDGRKVTARAKDKAAAEKTFEKAIDRGERATLAEKSAKHRFKMTMHALPARGTARIELTYVQTLTALGGERTFVFPSKGADQAPTLLDVQLRVRGDREILDLAVPNQADAVVARTKDGWTASVSRTRAGLRRDLVIRWLQESEDLDLAARAVRPDPEQPAFAEVRFAFNADPFAETRGARDVVLVVDTSLSMAGAPLYAARELDQAVLEQLTPGDRLEVVEFSSGVRPAFGELTFVEEDARDVVMARLDAMRAGGRSNLQAALAHAGKLLSESSNGVVVLATDGQPTYREHGSAFGLDVDPMLFRESRVVVAHFNYPKRADALEAVLPNVTTRFIPDGPASGSVVRSVARLAVAPTIEDVAIEVDGAHDVHGAIPTRIAVGEHVRLMARAGADGLVRVSGTLHGRPIETEVALIVPDGPDGDGDRGLPVEWARLRIASFEQEYRRLKDPAEKEVVEASIRGLGKEHNLATRFTSYVLTDSLYPDRIKPGDPEIRVHAPSSAKGVVAILPWGEVIKCTWAEDEGLWLGRFLVPRHIKDGLYRARILVEHQHATIYRGALFFRVDSKPPAYLLAREGDEALTRGGTVVLRAVPADREVEDDGKDHIARDPVDLKQVKVTIAGEVYSMHRTEDPEIFRIEIPVDTLPAGLHEVRMVAMDYARNTSETALDLVVPK